MADWEEWQKFGFRHFRSVGDVETATPSRGVVWQLPVSSFKLVHIDTNTHILVHTAHTTPYSLEEANCNLSHLLSKSGNQEWEH